MNTRSVDADERGRRRYHSALSEAPARWWTPDAAADFIAAAHKAFPGSVELDARGKPLPLTLWPFLSAAQTVLRL